MSVIFTCPENPSEWTLVELQGELQARGKDTDILSGDGFGGLEMGNLSLNKEGKAILHIGNAMLEGSSLPIPKPLVITKKRQVGDQATLEVVGVIRKKYIFKQRPVTIVPKK